MLPQRWDPDCTQDYTLTICPDLPSDQSVLFGRASQGLTAPHNPSTRRRSYSRGGVKGRGGGGNFGSGRGVEVGVGGVASHSEVAKPAAEHCPSWVPDNRRLSAVFVLVITVFVALLSFNSTNVTCLYGNQRKESN